MVPNASLPNDDALIKIISRSFPLEGAFQPLPGGENRSYRAGEIVYRYESRIQEATFVAELYASLPRRGFRLPQPIRTFQGTWVSPEGWSAWSFIEGRPAAWGDLPDDLDGYLEPYVTKLLAFRKPLLQSTAQLVHGDLNPANILVAPGLPPAFLDFTPNWYPPAYAIAVFAYWIGPARGDLDILNCFAHIPDFDQLLLRVAISKLMVHHELKKLERESANDIFYFQLPMQIVLDWLKRDYCILDSCLGT